MKKLVKRIIGNVFGFSEPKETYYDRMVRLKPVIDSNENIKKNISSAFAHEYSRQPLDSLVTFLGSGDTHAVYHVGNIRDPLTERAVHIAVRLGHFNDEPYCLEDPMAMLLARQLYQFEEAFRCNKNSLYFAGAVTWPWSDKKTRIAGFILEDVSENKKYRLVEDDFNFNYFRKCGWDGFEEHPFLLDPDLNKEPESREYFNDEARIDVD